MLQPAGRAVSPTAGIALRLRDRAALLRAEVVVGSPELTRVGLVALALVLQTIALLSPGHFRPAGAWYYAVLVAGSSLLGLACCMVATLPNPRLFNLRIRRLLGVSGIVSLGILSGMGVWHGALGVHSMMQGTPYNNDGAVMDLYAAGQVRHGHNPYVKTNIVAALAAIDAPSITTTPLMKGQFGGARSYPSGAAIQQVFLNVLRHQPRTIPPEFESKYNYPAGSFLFILPFIWAGIHDMRFLYALAAIAMGVYLWHRMPRALRPLAPLLVVGNLSLVVLTAGGQPDPMYGFFLLVGYAEWGSRRLSPLAMGVAIGIKQIAWFFLPFYLILVVREMGWREAARRLAIIVGLFLTMNLPFIVESPGSYVASISAPMTDPMFPLGIGVMALFVSGVLPMLPKIAFTIMELTAWFGGALVSIRARYLTAASGAVFAALPLFFAWRSLVNYLYLVPIIVLAIVLAEPAQRRSLRRPRV